MRTTAPPFALSVSTMHIQTAPTGVPKRLPFGTGRLEVLRIERVVKGLHQPRPEDEHARIVRARLQVKGTPASARSVVQEAILAFADHGVDPPIARADHGRGILRIYYPLSEFERVSELLRTGKRRLCYCWHSADSTRSVVMLMAVG